MLEALTSLTGQPLQRLKEDVSSKDNEAEKWRALVEHQCWILSAIAPRIYANNISDRLKESAEIGKKAEDILLDVSKVVKELEAVQTAVLSRRSPHLGLRLLICTQLRKKMELFNGSPQLISTTSMRDFGKMCKRPIRTRGNGSSNPIDLLSGNSILRASFGCMETVSDAQPRFGSSSRAC